MRSLALVLALAVISPPADACPAPRLIDVPLTADGATLLDDGGVVFETRNGASEPGIDTIGMTDGSTDLLVTHDHIAPGLSVARPPRGDGRTIKLVDRGKKVWLTLTQAKGTAKHPAPKVKALTSTLARGTATSQGPRYGVMASQAALTLAEAPAADVLAIVAFRVTKTGPQGFAWWKPDEGQGGLVFGYATGGKGCVPGPRPVRQGEKIAIGFIDIHGRTSLLSKTVVVGALRAK